MTILSALIRKKIMSTLISDLGKPNNGHLRLSIINNLHGCKKSLFKDIIHFALIPTFKEAFLQEVVVSNLQVFYGAQPEQDIAFIQCSFDLLIGFNDIASIAFDCQTEFGPTVELGASKETISKYRILYFDNIGNVTDSFAFVNHEEVNKFIANIIVNGDVISKENFNNDEISYDDYQFQRECLIQLAKSYL